MIVTISKHGEVESVWLVWKTPTPKQFIALYDLWGVKIRRGP
jgi:hypothetical protein